MPKIFISYRRNDASESASRLHETLTGCFGSQHIFWDYGSITAGRVFRREIQKAVNTCTTLLAVIGRNWLTVAEDGKRRIDDTDDIVRREIATALERAERGEAINVIPVLVEGASLPSKQDLPDDLKKLLERECIELRSQNWKESVEPLLKIIEKDFKAGFLYSFLGGSIAGLIAGVIVGWLYYANSNDPGVGPERIFIGSLYGLFSGATLSYFIYSGVTWRSRRLSKWPYSKIIGGVVGGAIGGILAGVAGGFLFYKIGGERLSPINLILAVASSAIFFFLGMLHSELKGAWHKTVLSIIIMLCVTLVAASIAVYLLEQQIPEGGAGISGSGLPFSPGVLILGLICGIMSGFQVGSALFIYDRFENELGNNP